MSRFDFIGSGHMRIISSTLPLGYKYVEHFYPEWQNEVLQSFGAFPHFQAIIKYESRLSNGVYRSFISF